MKIGLILCFSFLFTGCLIGNYQPEKRCAKAGVLVESISIEHNEVNDFQTIKTRIECKRLP